MWDKSHKPLRYNSHKMWGRSNCYNFVTQNSGYEDGERRKKKEKTGKLTTQKKT